MREYKHADTQMLHNTCKGSKYVNWQRKRDRSTAPLTKTMFHDLRDKKLDR
jgi:hypothetical protein